ncbi:MAG: leucine-rich repeat domain-containing protein, partial [Bacteroidaceae bacterium]|nr:leucine-rich repeat domain-containing protein [Bacteroidaceae bacterium]
MQGQKARELGSPDFRHPLRTEEDFNEHIDDFSIVSILLSLKAISIQPDLLNKYCASDRLLLSEKDYRDISQCTLLKELYPSTDSELNILLSLFTLALEKKNLSSVSFRLFDLARPKEVAKPIVYELANTKVTDEDLAEAWEDEYGVKYSKDRIRLLKGNDSLSSYTILQGTKVICDKAFSSYYCSPLKEITIPDSVTSIGNGAFDECESLKVITIPDSVTSIGDKAFFNCESLEEIIIPDSVTSIGEWAFCGCESLREITIPNSVTSIENGAFRECDSLEEITIPDS